MEFDLFHVKDSQTSTRHQGPGLDAFHVFHVFHVARHQPDIKESFHVRACLLLKPLFLKGFVDVGLFHVKDSQTSTRHQGHGIYMKYMKYMKCISRIHDMHFSFSCKYMKCISRLPFPDINPTSRAISCKLFPTSARHQGPRAGGWGQRGLGGTGRGAWHAGNWEGD